MSTTTKFVPSVMDGYLNVLKKTVYTPAISTLDRELLKMRKFRWWRKDSLLYYPYILYSAYYGLLNKNYDNFREKFEVEDDVLFIGDSGGFQNVTKNANLDPLRVLRWQEKNCDIGLILDVPPYKIEGDTRQFGGRAKRLFEKSLDKTVENAELMASNRTSKMKLYGVVQGETWGQMEEWYKAVSKNYEFDGYALSPKPSYDVMAVARYLLFSYEHGIKNIHILQESSVNCCSLIYAYSKLSKSELVTFDSTTYATLGIKRQYMLPYYMTKVFMYPKKREECKLKELPCNCPVCSLFRKQGVLLDTLFSGENAPSVYLSIHNLYITIQLHNLLDCMSDDLEIYRQLMNKLCRPKTLDALDFIIKGMEGGIDKAFASVGDISQGLDRW